MRFARTAAGWRERRRWCASTSAQGGTYGEERGSGARADVMERVERLRPVVKRLADLEVEAQHSFHNMKRRVGRAK